MKILLPLITILFPAVGFSQNIQTAKSASLGSVSFFPGEIESVFGNPAGLATVEFNSIITSVEQRFFIDDLNSIAAGIVLPTKSGTFGVSIDRFGFSEFKKQSFGIAYSRLLAKSIYLGAKVGIRHLMVKEYGSLNAVEFELGLSAEIIENLSLGVYISNPYQVESYKDTNVNSAFVFSMLYKLSEKANVLYELQQVENHELSHAFAVEYIPMSKLSVRAGTHVNPASFHFGVGIKAVKNIRFDLASRYDTTLGHTPTGGLVFNLN